MIVQKQHGISQYGVSRGYQFFPYLLISNRPWRVVADLLRQSVFGQAGVRRSLIFRVRPHRIFENFAELL